MKNWPVIMMTIFGLVLSAGSQDAAPKRVKVIKSNCNLRARALVTSEVVGQVSENDILIAKTINDDWVEVVPPTNIDFWVLGDYVKDGVIDSRQRVNVRAGAGINFNIVGQLPRGEKVDVRGVHAGWVKIAPPPSCSLWISRSLVSVIPEAEIQPARLAVAQAATAPAAPPQAQPEPVRATKPSSAPTDAPQKPVPTAVFSPPPGLDLVAGKTQGQWREVEGCLRTKGFIFRAPSNFRLTNCERTPGSSGTICFIKGNQAQLEALKYRHLAVSGREYWVKRQKYPVLVPERIILK